MVNNSFFRKTWAVTRYVIARILRVFSWCLMYTVILPLATMVLMTLFVLWKDNTTPGQDVYKRQTGGCVNELCRTRKPSC